MSKSKINNKSLLLFIILNTFFVCLPSCRYLEDSGIFRSRSLKKALIWAKQDSTRVADSLKRIGVAKNDGNEINQDSSPNFSSRKSSAENIRNKYHIIIGSFSDENNAKTRAKEYSTKGYKAEIIHATNRDGNKIGLVSIKSFEIYTSAIDYLKEFQHDIDSTAWIYPRH